VVGVFVAVLIMASFAVMLDSFYAVPHSGGNEVTWIQDLNGALRDSAVVSGVRGAVVPPVSRSSALSYPPRSVAPTDPALLAAALTRTLGA
jgi:hypothetical protein